MVIDITPEKCISLASLVITVTFYLPGFMQLSSETAIECFRTVWCSKQDQICLSSNLTTTVNLRSLALARSHSEKASTPMEPLQIWHNLLLMGPLKRNYLQARGRQPWGRSASTSTRQLSDSSHSFHRKHKYLTLWSSSTIIELAKTRHHSTHLTQPS